MSLRGLRLSFGVLTVLPVGEVQTDRRTARTAMLVAPVVGLLLGALAWTAGAAVTAAGGGSLLAAVTCLSVLAAATRGLHLDGLADLADGLGSAQPAEGALEVMHRPDIGPFGAVTLVLALLVQAAALDTAWEAGQAGPVLIVGVVTGRVALAWGCRVGVPAARTSGLGALVAGTVPTAAAVASTAVLAGLTLIWGLVLIPVAAPALVVTPLVGIAAALLLLRRARARLSGVTGDVLGAGVETATTATFVAAVLVLS